ncbi:hypothetical protein J0H33_05960 [bacterium]|nr:hypothetical protein [bacterium]
MRFQDICIGTDYGIRIRVSRQEPLVRVRVLEKVDRTKKLRVRHVSEPHTGMEEFIAQRQVMVAWKERRAFLRDEARLKGLQEASALYFDRVTADTVQLVLEASGEEPWVHGDGRISMERSVFERLAGRAGLGPDPAALDPDAFISREGECVLPLRAGEHLARAFAAAEPEAVTMYVAGMEQDYTTRGYAVGERWWHDELRKKRPIFALARQWAGFEQELARLNAEVQRLRNLLSVAEGDLRRAGDDRAAVRLRRAVNGG